MTAEQQGAWARLARAAAQVASLYSVGANTPAANCELFDATVGAVLAGLGLDETAEAMRAGWPALEHTEAPGNLEGYLERQARLDVDRLGWTLGDLAEGRQP